MGFLRLYLALVVVAYHFSNMEKFDTLVTGPLAVRVFYVISGFYIQLILSRYIGQEHGKRNFYLSRLLRLMPAYYLILLLTLWINGSTCNRFCTSMVINGTYSSLAFYYISNFLIVGQSLAKFLTYHYNNGYFSFDPTISRPDYWVSGMETLGQAWSITLELYFYLLAPYLLKKRSRDLIAIASISFMVKFCLALKGYDNINNWYNGFLPSELHTFLIGALGARVAADSAKLSCLKKYLLGCAAFCLAVWSTKKTLLPADPDELLVCGIACLLPFIFLTTRNSRIDRWAGELSYPIYLNHLLIIGLLQQYSPASLHSIVATIVLCIIAGIATAILIDYPVTRFRHKHLRVAGRTVEKTASPSPPHSLHPHYLSIRTDASQELPLQENGQIA